LFCVLRILPFRSRRAVGVGSELLPLKVSPPPLGKGSHDLQRLEELFKAIPERRELVAIRQILVPEPPGPES